MVVPLIPDLFSSTIALQKQAADGNEPYAACDRLDNSVNKREIKINFFKHVSQLIGITELRGLGRFRALTDKNTDSRDKPGVTSREARRSHILVIFS